MPRSQSAKKETSLNLNIDKGDKSRDISIDRLQQVQELLVGDIERSTTKRLARLEDRVNEQSQRIDSLSEQVTTFQVAIYDEFATQAEEQTKNLHALKELVEQQFTTALESGSLETAQNLKAIRDEQEEQFEAMRQGLLQESEERSRHLNDLSVALRAAADKIAE